jgi:glycosyltransferase involved in cell wall biosynthesis
MPGSRTVTGGMAADGDRFRRESSRVSAAERERRRRRLGLEGPVFLSVGRMVPRKGTRELLAGWELYSVRGGRGALCLVGGGPEFPALEDAARRARLAGVRFLGHVDHDSLPRTYALADVFVSATLEDNWSLVVPEAMACGLPVACSRYNGCWPELVDQSREGGNGKVFDPLKAEETAACLRFFAENRDALPGMGERSRAIEAGFTPRRAAAAALAACEAALLHRKRHSTRIHSLPAGRQAVHPRSLVVDVPDRPCASA